ncbi:Hint domain-containing protein [Albidovulum sp.]|uniref:Hint domain-containing protein n=1 Tax=Albidovulum sp. TaxID=1872424 RepID=UPI001D44BC66|nr:Hint domain-containing protein [Paracoccaceae bacterium]MCC0046868.1 Hint domain-containing protein [Defluviimonas sp.]HPE27100.1 Hint domain-containing protein [Albidovulum sp.]MCB2120283.1 Hint domain-containing protein [Paracoccaceae bacterium]MCB2131528.1 Hint domain-containing protein [Paracoccaceae bacterium]
MSMMFVDNLAREANSLGEGTFHGISEGTRIFTANGLRPVEALCAGDRIVTREGVRVLRRVWIEEHAGPAIHVKASTLGTEQPAQDMTFAAGMPVVMRQWRQRGKDARTVVPLLRLVDGVEICRGADEVLRTYTLQFDTDQVVYAAGLEVFCAGTGVDNETWFKRGNIFLS